MLDDEQDLIALVTPADVDPLTRLLQHYWPFPKRNRERSQHQRAQCLEEHVVWTVTVISIIAAAILLIKAIISLYIVKQPKKRLAMIVCYSSFCT